MVGPENEGFVLVIEKASVKHAHLEKGDDVELERTLNGQFQLLLIRIILIFSLNLSFIYLWFLLFLFYLTLRLLAGSKYSETSIEVEPHLMY